MFSCKVIIEVDADKMSEFIEFCHSIAAEMQKEEECRSLCLYRSKERTSSYILVSDWESEDAMLDHLQGYTFSLVKGGAIVLGRNFKLKTGETAKTDFSQWQRLNLLWSTRS